MKNFSNMKNNKERVKSLREISGTVTYSDPLTSFFYELLRDHLPAGVVEEIVHGVVNEPDEGCVFSNGWLAEYAHNLSELILNANGVRLKSDLDKVFSEIEKKRTAKISQSVKDELAEMPTENIDDEILAELATKLEEATGVVPSIDEKADSAISEATDAFEMLKNAGYISEDDADRLQGELEEASVEMKEELESAANSDEEVEEEKLPQAEYAIPPPPAPSVTGPKWTNTVNELNKQEDEDCNTSSAVVLQDDTSKI